MEEYYRYIEPKGKFYKYVTSNCREGALQMLSFLIDDSGYGSAIDTYYSLKKFEKIDYYEIPDGANILYEAKKNRICVSGTSEGPTYSSGTDIGWTKNTHQPMLYLFYVLPYKIFVVANSEKAAYAKLFPIESITSHCIHIQPVPLVVDTRKYNRTSINGHHFNTTPYVLGLQIQTKMEVALL